MQKNTLVFQNQIKEKVRALFSFNPMEDSFLKMVLENNGSPFPPIIKSIEDFAKNKNTSDIEAGQGYGGGMVKRIADKYSLDPILISDSNNEFPVKFIFKFQTHELV